MRGSFLAAVLAASSCGGESGVLVAASWDPGVTIEALDLEVAVGSRAPTTETLTAGAGPMQSPYRVLVKSPADQPVDVRLVGRQGTRAVASGRISVTPDDREILQVALHLAALPPPRCGDGARDAGEECDDDNREDRDGCTNACTCARCGDGILQAFPSSSVGDGCGGMPEECDDGNGASLDGCSATCRRE